MEVLAYYFPVVGPYEATLRFHWGPTIIPLRIEVGRRAGRPTGSGTGASREVPGIGQNGCLPHGFVVS